MSKTRSDTRVEDLVEQISDWSDVNRKCMPLLTLEQMVMLFLGASPYSSLQSTGSRYDETSSVMDVRRYEVHLQ